MRSISLVDAGREALASNAALITVDFWDTLVKRTVSPSHVLGCICHELVEAFGLRVSSDDVQQIYVDYSRALADTSRQLERDREYRSGVAWTCVLRELRIAPSSFAEYLDKISELEVAHHVRHSAVSDEARTFVNSMHERRWLVVSDNEFSAAQLQSIAADHSLNLPMVLASSQFGLTKYSSALFPMIANYEQIALKDIFHIGDDVKSDRSSPEGLGVRVPSLPLELTPFGARERASHLRTEPKGQSFKKELTALGEATGQFLRRFIYEYRDGAMAAFMGSEGYFFAEILIKATRSARIAPIVFNYGRRQILNAVLPLHPDWVIQRWMLERIPIQQLGHFVEHGDGPCPDEEGCSVKGHQVADRFWSEGTVIGAANDLIGQRSRVVENDLREKLAGSDLEVFVVDVGYRATTAFALSLLIPRPVIPVMMLGDLAYVRAGFENYLVDMEIEGATVWNRDVSKEVPRVITHVVECFLSQGPRAAERQGYFWALQTAVEASALQVLDSDVYAEVDSFESFMGMAAAPSHRLARTVMANGQVDDLVSVGSPSSLSSNSWRSQWADGYYAGLSFPLRVGVKVARTFRRFVRQSTSRN